MAKEGKLMIEKRTLVAGHTLARIVPRECHLSQKGARSELGGPGENQTYVWVIDNITIRSKVLLGYGHKYCLPQGQ